MVSVLSAFRSVVLFVVLAFAAQHVSAEKPVDNDVRQLIENANLDPRFLNDFLSKDFEVKESHSDHDHSHSPTTAPTMAPIEEATPEPTSAAGTAQVSKAMAIIAGVAAAFAGAAVVA